MREYGLISKVLEKADVKLKNKTIPEWIEDNLGLDTSEVVKVEDEDRGITKRTCEHCGGSGRTVWYKGDEEREEDCGYCKGTGYEYMVEGKDEVDNEMLIVCLRGGSYHSMIRVRWNDLTNEKGDNLNMDMTNAVEAVYEYLWKIIGEGVVVEWIEDVRLPKQLKE